MITEDYISFETAKLLKEKRFDIDECEVHYDPEDHTQYDITLQMAMKWLREIHNLVIEPYRTGCGYLYTISNIPYGSNKYDNAQAFNGDDKDSGQWTTWEKACEDGIKHCLEKLI